MSTVSIFHRRSSNPSRSVVVSPGNVAVPATLETLAWVESVGRGKDLQQMYRELADQAADLGAYWVVEVKIASSDDRFSSPVGNPWLDIEGGIIKRSYRWLRRWLTPKRRQPYFRARGRAVRLAAPGRTCPDKPRTCPEINSRRASHRPRRSAASDCN